MERQGRCKRVKVIQTPAQRDLMTGIKSVYTQFRQKMEKKAAKVEDSKEDKEFLAHLEKQYRTN